MKSIDLTEDTVEADGPPKKKLKQATLQFQVRSPVTKKRKLSDAYDDTKTLKQVKTDCKENLASKPRDQQSDQPEIEVLDTDIGSDTSREKDSKENITDGRALKCEMKDRETSGDFKILAEVCDNTVKVEETSKEANKLNEQIASGSQSSVEGKTRDNFKLTKELVVVLTAENLEESLKAKTSEPVGQTEVSTIKLSDSEDEKTLSNDDIVTSDSDSEDDKSVNENTESNKNDPTTPLSTPLKDVSRKLTPKQIQRKLESAKKREDRERSRRERERKRQEEREEKLKQKQEKEEEKRKEREEREEQKRKEREEKEEQKRKEKEEKEELKRREREEKEQKRKDREEKEKKRQAEIDLKNEERRKREEQKEEAALKIKKAAAAFEKFFVPKKIEGKQENVKAAQDLTSKFKPFQLKSDMRMAPTIRRTLENDAKDALRRALDEQNIAKEGLYLTELKTGKPTGSSPRTWLVEDSKDSVDDVICIDDEAVEICGNLVETAAPAERQRAKLLQFSENRRPPYWGTWRKRSKNIKSRRPFGTDKIFNYEVDSDDEWEEEEPGESLHGSDDDESGSDNEYDIDNDFMVPHGYLSDEEALVEEDDALTPETHKAKLELLEKEFQAEMKSKTERLKPRLIGCLWANENNDRPTSGSEVIWKFLSARRMMTGGSVVFPERGANTNVEDPTSPSNQEQSAGKRKRVIPEQFVPDLIRLVHGNANGKTFLFKEFKAHLSGIDPELEFSRRGFEIKIKEIAKWICVESDGPLLNKYCWVVKDEVLEAYRCDAIGMVNAWKYVLNPPKNTVYRKSAEDGDKSKLKVKKKSGPDIKQFTKIMSNEEKQKQFALQKQADKETAESSKQSPSVKKRVQFTTLESKKTGGEGSSKNICIEADKSVENVAGNCKSSERAQKKRAVLTSVPKAEINERKAPVSAVRSNLLTQFIKKIEKKEGIFKENCADNDKEISNLNFGSEQKNEIKLTENSDDGCAVVAGKDKLVNENLSKVESSSSTAVNRTRVEKLDDEKSTVPSDDRSTIKSNSDKPDVPRTSETEKPAGENIGEEPINRETNKEKPTTDENQTNDAKQ